jgi:tRNA 2-thiouridine synthesizing protein B
MLHTVNKSPFEKNSLQTCIRLSLAGHSILLIEDGVYGALQGTAAEADVKACLQDRKVYALGPDLKARGIDASSLIDGVEVAGYEQFVELAASCDKVQTWL